MVVKTDNTRHKSQRDVYTKIAASGKCPFCGNNLAKVHKEPILHDGEYWIVTPNQWPRENAQIHLLLILKRHATEVTELTPQEWKEFGTLLAKYAYGDIPQSGCDGAAVLFRYGNPEQSGASVLHLHAQLIVPKKAVEGQRDKVRISV